MPDRPAALPDVAGVPLLDLLHSGDPAIAAGIARLVADADRSAQAISGWSSFIDQPDPKEAP